jgi:tetratricopeptide (TPR) repeat protein
MRHLLRCFILLLLFSPLLRAQRPLADSLAHWLAQHPQRDTGYILNYCRMAGAQLFFDPGMADSNATVALALARENRFGEGELFALNLRGIAAQRQGRYADAIDFYLPALDIAEREGNTDRLAKTLNNLGLAYFYAENYAQAERHFRRALPLQRRPNEQAALLNNLGLVSKNQGKADSALTYFHRALPLAQSVNNHRGMANAYSNIGQIHRKRREYAAAERFFRLALDADQAGGDRNGETISRCNLGATLADLRRFEEAMPLLHTGLALARQRSDLNTQHYAAEELAAAHERSNRPDSAIFWLKNAQILKDSLREREETERVADITARYARDQKLLQAERTIERARQSRRLWVGGTLALAALLALTGYAWWQARRRRRAESRLLRAEMDRFRAEQELREQREAALQHSLQDRERTVASQSMQLMQQKELLGQVSDRIQEAAAQGNNPQQLKSLLRLLDNHAQNDEQWEQFKSQFESVHSGFFQRLLAQQPNLTAFDLRYCAYLRMNLTSKEIANLLGTSLRSVETQRYRLRKKLSIPGEQDLVAWMVRV